jgi:hypothetical protein
MVSEMPLEAALEHLEKGYFRFTYTKHHSEYPGQHVFTVTE